MGDSRGPCGRPLASPPGGCAACAALPTTHAKAKRGPATTVWDGEDTDVFQRRHSEPPIPIATACRHGSLHFQISYSKYCAKQIKWYTIGIGRSGVCPAASRAAVAPAYKCPAAIGIGMVNETEDASTTRVHAERSAARSRVSSRTPSRAAPTDAASSSRLRASSLPSAMARRARQSEKRSTWLEDQKLVERRAEAAARMPTVDENDKTWQRQPLGLMDVSSHRSHEMARLDATAPVARPGKDYKR